MKNAQVGQDLARDSAELLWIQNNNPDDPGPDRPGCGESGRISKWHMTDAKDDTVHGNLRGNLEMLQNIQSHGGWYSRDEIIIQVKLFKLECVWFPLRAQSQPASPFTDSWWLFMPSAGNYRSSEAKFLTAANIKSDTAAHRLMWLQPELSWIIQMFSQPQHKHGSVFI